MSDLTFESADDTLKVVWHVYQPEIREPEEPPWESHDWTNDYDYPDEYSPDHDEEFE